MIAINKADGDNAARARATAGDYRAALNILAPRSAHWTPPVVTYSALTEDGVAGLWRSACDHRAALTASGEFAERRRQQQVKWMWTMLEERLFARLRTDAAHRARVKEIEAAVAAGTKTPAVGADDLATLIER
jgi:LAO/AO transport system kinase